MFKSVIYLGATGKCLRMKLNLLNKLRIFKAIELTVFHFQSNKSFNFNVMTTYDSTYLIFNYILTLWR